MVEAANAGLEVVVASNEDDDPAADPVADVLRGVTRLPLPLPLGLSAVMLPLPVLLARLAAMAMAPTEPSVTADDARAGLWPRRALGAPPPAGDVREDPGEGAAAAAGGGSS